MRFPYGVTMVFGILLLQLTPTFSRSGKSHQNKLTKDLFRHDVNHLNETSRRQSPQVEYYLYTLNNSVPIQIYVSKPLANAGKVVPGFPIKIIIHGFLSSPEAPTVQELRKAYQSEGNYNIILVDWSKYANTLNYIAATEHTFRVGKNIAKLIQNLIRKNVIKPSQVHIIGHSLGAHIAGIAGKFIGPKKVARITGLDPALPLYDSASSNWRLTKNDARFVDVIHTNAGTLGITRPLGHSDFYPNGGKVQPGCGVDLFGVCSHSQALELFAKSVIEHDKFRAKRCDSVKRAILGRCKNMRTYFAMHMGETAKKDLVDGIYYVRTGNINS